MRRILLALSLSLCAAALAPAPAHADPLICVTAEEREVGPVTTPWQRVCVL